VVARRPAAYCAAAPIRVTPDVSRPSQLPFNTDGSRRDGSIRCGRSVRIPSRECAESRWMAAVGRQLCDLVCSRGRRRAGDAYRSSKRRWLSRSASGALLALRAWGWSPKCGTLSVCVIPATRPSTARSCRDRYDPRGRYVGYGPNRTPPPNPCRAERRTGCFRTGGSPQQGPRLFLGSQPRPSGRSPEIALAYLTL